MGSNGTYKKLVKNYKKNESQILFWALMKQRDKMFWSSKRLYKINPKSKKLLRQVQKGINKHFNTLLNP